MVETLVDRSDTIGDELVMGIVFISLVMDMKPKDEFKFYRFRPGSSLPDLNGHYWCRQGKMSFMFLSSVKIRFLVVSMLTPSGVAAHLIGGTILFIRC